MKKVISSGSFLFTVFASMAQSEIQPAAPVQEPTGSSVWVKIAVAIAAIAVMALIFYLGKLFNNRKKASNQ